MGVHLLYIIETRTLYDLRVVVLCMTLSLSTPTSFPILITLYWTGISDREDPGTLTGPKDDDLGPKNILRNSNHTSYVLVP